jgi:hypothetical protein
VPRRAAAGQRRRQLRRPQHRVPHRDREFSARFPARHGRRRDAIVLCPARQRLDVVLYGATPNSRIEFAGTSVVRLWYLSSTVDQFGNQISYSYDENSTTGEVFPTEITWTSNAGQGLSPRYKVVITPEPRPADDQRSGHDTGGAPWASTKRIDRIDVIYDGTTTISTYDLTYCTPAATGTGRSQLERVTLCRGVDCLPETLFTVQDGNRGWGSLAGTGAWRARSRWSRIPTATAGRTFSSV